MLQILLGAALGMTIFKLYPKLQSHINMKMFRIILIHDDGN